MARLVAVRVSIPFWLELTTKGYKVGRFGIVECTEGLPEGAELVNSWYDGEHNSVVFVFHHPSFVDVPEGGQCPFLVPIYDYRTFPLEDSDEQQMHSTEVAYVRGRIDGAMWMKSLCENVANDEAKAELNAYRTASENIRDGISCLRVLGQDWDKKRRELPKQELSAVANIDKRYLDVIRTALSRQQNVDYLLGGVGDALGRNE